MSDERGNNNDRKRKGGEIKDKEKESNTGRRKKNVKRWSNEMWKWIFKKKMKKPKVKRKREF